MELWLEDYHDEVEVVKKLLDRLENKGPRKLIVSIYESKTKILKDDIEKHLPYL